MGLICLQGGGEFSPPCRDMDALLLDAAGGGPVAVLPLASAPRDYDPTAAEAVRHLTALGARDVRVADPRRPQDVLDGASLVVLPGGSPARLHAALQAQPLRNALSRAANDAVVMGASAGAMLLCAWTVLPEDGLSTAEGLGAVGDFAVLPHYDGPRPEWEAALAAYGVDLLGIPECSGVLLDGENVTAVGAQAATLITKDGRETLSLG
jgi:peptidase E